MTDHPTTGQTRAVTRSRRPSRRRALVAGLTVATLALGAGSAVAVSNAYKTVTLDVDGDAQELRTFAGSVENVLAAEGIEIGGGDVLAPAADTELTSGTEIVVRTGRYVSLDVDGEPTTAWVAAADATEALGLLSQRGGEVRLVASRSDARTELPLAVHAGQDVAIMHDGGVTVAEGAEDIHDLLAAAGVAVDGDDRVHVTDAATAGVADADLPEGAAVPEVAVVVQRVEVETRVRHRDIDHKTRTEDDPDRYEDLDPAVHREGEPGQRTVVRQVVTVDGEVESNEKVSEMVTREPVTEILHQGTKERPEPEPEPTQEPATSSGSGSSNGTTSSGSGSAANVPTGSNRQIGQQMAAARGWTGDQWGCLERLWTKESNWNHRAQNPSSGAYGIPQSLPGNKMAAAGSDWQTNPATQIQWGLDYIAGRYGTPCSAWAHSERVNWY